MTLTIFQLAAYVIYGLLAVLSLFALSVGLFKLGQFAKLGVGRRKEAEKILEDWLNGRVEEALTYYQAALAIDPNYTLVREYMGEAYLQLGQVDKARAQLKEIAMRCGTECREYALLEAEIEKAVQ